MVTKQVMKKGSKVFVVFIAVIYAATLGIRGIISLPLLQARIQYLAPPESSEQSLKSSLNFNDLKAELAKLTLHNLSGKKFNITSFINAHLEVKKKCINDQGRLKDDVSMTVYRNTIFVKSKSREYIFFLKPVKEMKVITTEETAHISKWLKNSCFEWRRTMESTITLAERKPIIAMFRKYLTDYGIARADVNSVIKGINNDIKTLLSYNNKDKEPALKSIKKFKGELLDIVDDNDIPIKKKEIEAGFAHLLGLRHRTANVFVFTPKGKLILQRRVHNKAEAMRMSIFGGHVTSGHEYAEAILREVAEELHFDNEPKGNIVLIGNKGQFRNDDTKNNEFRSLYAYFMTQSEYEIVQQRKKEIDKKRRERDIKEFKEFIEYEQEAKSGYGEVWGYQEVDLKSLVRKRALTVKEQFKDKRVEEEVEYTSDLLLPLVEGTAPLRIGAVDPMTELEIMINIRKRTGRNVDSRSAAAYLGYLMKKGDKDVKKLKNLIEKLHNQEASRFTVKNLVYANPKKEDFKKARKGALAKYTGDTLKAIEYKGVTTVSPIPDGEFLNLMQRIIGNKKNLSNDKGITSKLPSINTWQKNKKKFFATVPIGSEHMTIYDAISDGELPAYEGAFSFDKLLDYLQKSSKFRQFNAATIQEIEENINNKKVQIDEAREIIYAVIEKRIKNVLKKYHSLTVPVFKPVGISAFPPNNISKGKTLFIVRMRPVTAEDLAAVTAVQDAIEQATGIRNFGTFAGHVTLGYLVNPPETREEFNIFKKYLSDLNKYIASVAENPQYHIEMPVIHLSRFFDMDSFPPVEEGEFFWTEAQEMASAINNGADFCEALNEKWDQRMEQGNVFRYGLEELQRKPEGSLRKMFNPEREGKRPRQMDPTKLFQPFTDKGFNFTKVYPNEIMAQGIDLGGVKTDIIVNVNPFMRGHILITPERSKRHPQYFIDEVVTVACAVLKKAGRKSYKIAYNSVGAFASINQLHLQAFDYGFDTMPVEITPKKELFSHDGVTVSVLPEWPVNTLVLSANSIKKLKEHLMAMVGIFHKNNQPYNIVFTRNAAQKPKFDVFVFPRQFESSSIFGTGVAYLELAGEILFIKQENKTIVQSRKMFEKADEEQIKEELSKVGIDNKTFFDIIISLTNSFKTTKLARKLRTEIRKSL